MKVSYIIQLDESYNAQAQFIGGPKIGICESNADLQKATEELFGGVVEIEEVEKPWIERAVFSKDPEHNKVEVGKIIPAPHWQYGGFA